jgi:hypothetical protein
VPGNRRQAAAAALGAAWPGKGRHEAQLALAGALRAEGWSAEEAVEFLCDVCRAAGDEDRTKREATVRHTWGREAGAPLTGWTRLKARVDPVVVEMVRGGMGRDAEWTERTERKLEAAVFKTSGIETSSAPNLSNTVASGPFVFKVGGFDAELPPIDWQVDTLVARGDVVMFVAHGNSLKTWLAFSLAHAVASGRPWLGRFVTSRGRAGILDFESGDYETTRRLKLIGVRDEQVEDRLLRTSYPAAQLSDPESWIALAEQRLSLVIVDSFNAASPDLDENDARAALMLQHAGRFAERTSCSVLFVHHARKGQGGDRREAVRGSTALFAACDRIFEFTDVEKKDGGAGVVLATMRSVKDGAGRAPAPIRVELSDQGLRWVEAEPEPQEDTPEKNRKIVLDVLRNHSAGVCKEDLVNVMKGKRERKFELLSQLALGGLTIEFKDSADKKILVMLRPGIEV